jgi:hypothetical protein
MVIMLRALQGMLLVLFLIGLAPTASQAQQVCGDRTELLETLETTYQETPRAIGLAQDGGLLELLIAPSGGWTILVTRPGGPTCVLTTGDSWESAIAIAGQPI